jgi:hypothetical protein
MNDDTPDDLPTELTRLLRNVDGVHTVYATKSLIPTVVGAVVEAVRNDQVGMHLVTVDRHGDDVEIVACIGVLPDESAVATCRRAHDALRDFFVDNGQAAPSSIAVKVGRVG